MSVSMMHFISEFKVLNFVGETSIASTFLRRYCAVYVAGLILVSDGIIAVHGSGTGLSNTRLGSPISTIRSTRRLTNPPKDRIANEAKWTSRSTI